MCTIQTTQTAQILRRVAPLPRVFFPLLRRQSTAPRKPLFTEKIRKTTAKKKAIQTERDRLRASFPRFSPEKIQEILNVNKPRSELVPVDNEKYAPVRDMYNKAKKDFDLPEDFEFYLAIPKGKKLEQSPEDPVDNFVDYISDSEIDPYLQVLSPKPRIQKGLKGIFDTTHPKYLFVFAHGPKKISLEGVHQFSCRHELAHAESFYLKEKKCAGFLQTNINLLKESTFISNLNVVIGISSLGLSYSSTFFCSLVANLLVINPLFTYHKRKEENYADKRALEAMNCSTCCTEASEFFLNLEESFIDKLYKPKYSSNEKEPVLATIIGLMAGEEHPSIAYRAYCLQQRGLELSKEGSLCSFHKEKQSLN